MCVFGGQCTAVLTGSVDSPVWNSRGFICTKRAALLQPISADLESVIFSYKKKLQEGEAALVSSARASITLSNPTAKNNADTELVQDKVNQMLMRKGVFVAIRKC